MSVGTVLAAWSKASFAMRVMMPWVRDYLRILRFSSKAATSHFEKRCPQVTQTKSPVGVSR